VLNGSIKRARCRGEKFVTGEQFFPTKFKEKEKNTNNINAKDFCMLFASCILATVQEA